MDERWAERAFGRKVVWTAIACALFALLLTGPAAQAQKAEKRIALVIGNSAYRNTAVLPNPVNDSQDIAAALRQQSFTVLLEQNLDKAGMEDAVARFARMAQDADAALFYYAGHGMQYRGSNYLVPVDARLEDEFRVPFELTRLDDVLFGLERARSVKILILDACRDNPLLDHLTQTASSRDLMPTHGLAKIAASRGMVIAYATQADHVAIDGSGRNSPFTQGLIKEMAVPGVEIGTMFRRVAADVDKTTNGRQLPELSVSLVGDFYLNTHDTDVQAWSKIHDSTDPKTFSNFILDHPDSALITDAREHIAALDRAKEERLAAAQREQAARAQAAKEEAERQQEEAARQQAAKDQAERLAQQQKEEAARQQAAKATAERLAQQQQQEQAAREQAAKERAERLAQQQKEEAVREQAAKAAAERLAQQQEEAAREQVAKEQAARLAQQRKEAAEHAKPPPVAAPPPGAAPEAPKPTAQIAMLTPPTQPPAPKPADVLSGDALVEAIKKELTRVGCYSGAIDDNWSSAETKSSVSTFVKYAKLPAVPAEPAVDFLDTLHGKFGRVCPLEEENSVPKRKARNEDGRHAHRHQGVRSAGQGPHNTCLQPALCGGPRD